MAGLNSIDDSNWAEVKHINCYAMFMGYLWMAMRGLGLLVVTWTTVVLLGGFVSMLNKKDFWCLTVITLVQAAGVFNIHPSENLAAIPRLCLNFLRTMNIRITWEGAQGRTDEGEGPIRRRQLEPSGQLCVGARKVVAFGVAVIQALVFFIILCPVAALYGFGLYITTALALWRLIKHDYGISGGERTNMYSALFVLYVLAVLQGAVFCYRGLLRFAGKKIVNQVAQGYKFEQGADSPVLGYLDESRMGCEKDPSFARGRNLITYALDLMESDSPDDLLSGTRILDTLITYDKKKKRSFGDSQNCRRIPMVTERLIGPSSSGKIFQKLLKALDSRSPCDKEMTKRASRVVLSLAGGIRSKQFPEGVGCISSLLDASRWEANEYKQLMLEGLRIIEKIVSHEDNCVCMSARDIGSLLVKVLRPLSSNILHHVSHDACADLVDASLQLQCTWQNTVNRMGYSGLEVPKEAIRAMETIVTCDKCPKKRRILAMKVLVTQLNIQDKENIIIQLLGIFLDYKKDKHITGLAGEKLHMLSKESKSNAKIILEANNGSVEKILTLLRIEGIGTCTVGILEGLCSHYIASHLGENEPCFENLKRLIIGSMPELLIQALPPQQQRPRNVSTDIVYVESQNKAVVSPDKSKQHGDKKSQAALLSLCFTVYHNMLNEEDDLPLLLEAVCSKDAQFNLPGRLIEMVERNSDPTAVDCLRILKCAAKMAMSMMRHKRIYPTQDLARLMDSLRTVDPRMRHLDAFVLLSGADSDRSLCSIVWQAYRLFRPREEGKQDEVSSKGKESEITEPSGPSTTFEKEAQISEDMKLKEPEITELFATSTFDQGQSSSS